MTAVSATALPLRPLLTYHIEPPYSPHHSNKLAKSLNCNIATVQNPGTLTTDRNNACKDNQSVSGES